MFDGDQFHQFMASRTSLQIPLSFHLHENPSFPSAAFDPYQASSLNTETLEQLHHQDSSPNSKDIHIDLRERELDPWSNDEVLALLKLRSSMEIWFPDFTWEHISRKLAELGFKRSAEQCKNRFEDESKHFNSTVNYSKNYRNILSELDEFYPADQEEARVSAGKSHETMEKQDREKNIEENSRNMTANPSQESEEVVKKTSSKKKKRRRKKKRRDKFEIFKGFCEAVVNKMMVEQEELHSKLIEDIVKMDENKIAREQAWKNREMDRLKMEIETRAKEQASTGERQATLIKFLKKFTPEDHHNFAIKIHEDHNNTWNSSTILNTSSKTISHQNPPSPSSSFINESPLKALTLETTTNYEKAGDTSKRWPRDEVLALINLRCKLSNNIDEIKEGTKGPLWEKISQGMLQLGYERNAKRCKEKWENINKYFRKTKDSNKKRSINSRTCPYFHQLSCLYSQGTHAAPTDLPKNIDANPAF